MKRKLILCLAMIVAVGTMLVGCSFEDEATVASCNISKEADNFNVYRKITVINNQTDTVMLEFEGWCSIEKDNTDYNANEVFLSDLKEQNIASLSRAKEIY